MIANIEERNTDIGAQVFSFSLGPLADKVFYLYLLRERSRLASPRVHTLPKPPWKTQKEAYKGTSTPPKETKKMFGEHV